MNWGLGDGDLDAAIRKHCLEATERYRQALIAAAAGHLPATSAEGRGIVLENNDETQNACAATPDDTAETELSLITNDETPDDAHDAREAA